MQNGRQLEVVQRKDCLRDEAQHHRRAPQCIKQIDAHPHKRKSMRPVELLALPEVVDLLWSEQFSEPILKLTGLGGRPIRANDLAAGSKSWTLPNPKVNIGMPLFMSDANDLLQGRGWRRG